MAKRRRKRTKLEPVDDLYGLRPSTVEKFSSGCAVLDCVLGGGWACSRVLNIVGQKSTGKTLLGTEACANFKLKYPKGRVRVAEAEAAFDVGYAVTMGMPEDVEYPEVFTVEDVFEDLEPLLEDPEPMLYVVDSLDALSDRAEQDRSMDDGTYGTKARVVSEWFRRQNQRLAKSCITLLIVSQLRDNVGVKFGPKYKRSGGHAMDFYASQILWLREVGKVERTMQKVKEVVGIDVEASCKRNKVGKPFKKCQLPMIFDYGVEDVRAGLDWLIEKEKTNAIGLTVKQAQSLKRKLDRLTADEYGEERANISDAVRREWEKIEVNFRPKRRKYPETHAV